MITLNKENSSFFNSLQAFNSIGLKDIDCVKLMNRFETKFIVPIGEINSLFDTLSKEYNILESNMNRVFPYATIYFDTNDYLFYNQHIRGQLDRFKIRYRKYEYTGESFLEIKKKTNRGRTIKWRIPNNFSSDSFDEEAILLLTEHSPVDAALIKPVLLSGFSRVTLINIQFKERITIDYDISFTELNEGGKIDMPYLAIAELKKDGNNHSGPFIRKVREMNIHQSGFSKYCIGNALLNNSLKKNILKPRLLSLTKIKNEHIRYCSS